jgi:hypothetical protein
MSNVGNFKITEWAKQLYIYRFEIIKVFKMIKRNTKLNIAILSVLAVVFMSNRGGSPGGDQDQLQIMEQPAQQMEAVITVRQLQLLKI